MNKIYAFLTIVFFNLGLANAATVVATVNGNPITDADITARTELMARQGNTSATNRKQALQNIVDDYVKLDHAAKFNVKPTDKDADKELQRMNLGDLSPTARSMARLAVRADIAWQVIVARTIVPTIDVYLFIHFHSPEMALIQFFISMAIVMGPTPPGTGVM